MSDDTVSDEDLVARAVAGDQAAFEALVIRHQQQVRSFLSARASHLALVEEVLQNTFVTAWGRLDTFRHDGSLQGWLKGIARNLLLQEYRTQSRSTAVDVDKLDLIMQSEMQQRLEADEEYQADELERLRHCLEQLPERSRTLLIRHHAEGLPLNRLAQQFKKSRAAIAKILYTVRKNLRVCVERGVVR